MQLPPLRPADLHAPRSASSTPPVSDDVFPLSTYSTYVLYYVDSPPLCH